MPGMLPIWATVMMAAASVGVTWHVSRTEARPVRPILMTLLAVAGALMLLPFGIPAAAVIWFAAIAVACAAIAIIDVQKRIIPDELVALLMALALLAPFETAIIEQLLSAVMIGGLFWVVRAGYFLWRQHHGLGLGDVKLAFAMGMLVGIEASLWATAVATTVTACWLVRQQSARASSDTHEVPMNAPLGTGLAAAMVATLAWQLAGSS